MQLRYPIILVHGLNGFDQLELALGQAGVVRIDYFRKVAGWLAEAGVPRVYAAALPPHGSIARRSWMLMDFISREVAEPHFHLVAHSMGGLDSRHYLSNLGGAERGALSLTTLGTPHRGSSLATIAVDSVLDPALRLARRFRMGKALRYGVSHTAAHRDLCPDACADFNLVTPDVPGVAYFSWAGAPPPQAVQWPLRLGWHLLRRAECGGDNDGLVTVASARWSGWRGTVPADHLSLIGWQFSSKARILFEPGEFYRAIVRDLAAVERESD